MSCFDLANEFCCSEVVDLLTSRIHNANLNANVKGSTGADARAFYLTNQNLLKDFYSKFNRDHANLDVIFEMLKYAYEYSTCGTILVFLPDYSDVMDMYRIICSGPLHLEVYVLHSYLTVEDFNRPFLPATKGRRKVVLTTAMAETSVTFDDVVCVIDSGLIRDKEHDVVYLKHQNSYWISKVRITKKIFIPIYELAC